jgi:oxygen-independent coproporphyrinogen-3 oxidase
MSPPLSLYVHLPFCHHKCSYCDLNAYAGLNDLIPAYVGALTAEIRLVGQGTDSIVHTIYCGGGTPSITPLSLLAEIFSAIRDSFATTNDLEISFEANPDTLTDPYLTGLKQLGINRLSIGAQSAQPNELALFQRTHTFDDVVRAVDAARTTTFENISLDLIYGIPGQTLELWQATFAKMLALVPEHFSIYALSYDFNTPMRTWIQRGLLAEPDGELAAQMYEWADEVLLMNGYEQYEISSWSKIPTSHSRKSQYQCQHNLQYWHNQPYLGLGAGAHGYYEGQRYANISSPTAYVERMRKGEQHQFPFSPALLSSIEVDDETEMKETLLTGLRLVQEGVSAANFQNRFGMKLDEVFKTDIRDLLQRKLVTWDGDRLKLTREARMVSNWVFERFV